MLPERLRLLLGSPLALCHLASVFCPQPGHLQIAPTANTWVIPAGALHTFQEAEGTEDGSQASFCFPG